MTDSLRAAMPSIDKIASKAQELATHSWEYGAVSQALIEIYDPSLSPFFGPAHSLESIEEEAIAQARGLTYAKKYIRTDQNALIDGEGMDNPI
jgi:hypothetical protein